MLDFLRSLLLFGVGVGAVCLIHTGIAAIVRAVPAESRAAIFFVGYLSVTVPIFAPFSEMISPNQDKRLSIPFNFPVEIIRDPWRPMSLADLWQTGCWDPRNVFVLLYLIGVVWFFHLSPLLPCVTFPSLLQRFLNVFDKAPEDRGHLFGASAMLLLNLAFVLLISFGELKPPCWVTAYVVWLAIANLSAICCKDPERTIAYVTVGGFAGWMLQSSLETKTHDELTRWLRDSCFAAVIVHVVLLLAWVVVICTPAIGVVRILFLGWLEFAGCLN